MTAAEIAGLAVVAVGLTMMLAGTAMALGELRRAGRLGAASDFVDALARLVKALAGQRSSVVLFTFGTLLVFLGAVILGASSLLS